jgi:hypothetical protein
MIQKLQSLLTQLESQISEQETVNTEVSQANVGWHIEHSLLTIERIIYALSKSNPADYRWSFRLPRYIIFTMGKIPRGKAKAPSIVQPAGPISTDSLLQQIEHAKQTIQKLESLTSGNFFPHPYFGNLKLKKAIQCLEIHTKHHLDIIRDICKEQD